MLGFLKRLFGGTDAPSTPRAGSAPAGGAAPESPAHTSARRQSDAGTRVTATDQHGASRHGEQRDAVGRYFELSEAIVRARADRDFPAAIRAARASYPLLPAFVAETVRDFGRFDIVTSHAVHTAPTLMAVLEDRAAIHELRATLERTPELRDWLPAAEQAEEDLVLVGRILAAVRAEPGLVQSSLRTRLGLADGSRTSTLAAWMEKGGRLQRVKKGASYQLYPAGVAIPAAAAGAAGAGAGSTGGSPPPHPASGSGLVAPAPVVVRRRPARPAETAVPIDLSRLPVVRLPLAPAAWEERAARSTTEESADGAFADVSKMGAKARGAQRGAPRFTVEGAGWTLRDEVKLRPAERPDPAYKEVFHTGRFTHWLDPKGQRVGHEHAVSVLRTTDRTGATVAEVGLAHDVYRADVNADGTGILFLSREGMLHAYTERGTGVLLESLLDLAEYKAQAERFGIEPRELKTHVRCVALSADRARYLVTVVDEAWCVDAASGRVIWGLRMPTKEGWTRRVAERSTRAGTSADVEAALWLMELELPVTPEAITRQYRALAMRWHPDRNPGDPSATARFQALAAATELLTGTDLSRLSARQIETVTYEQVLSTSRVVVDDPRGSSVGFDLTLSMVVGERFAVDWIYAANLGRDGRAYLAAYSGKVVVVSPAGIPERVYDVGAVPRHVTDAGDRLYILTDTRLYVLSGDRLDALVDVYGAGDVVVADRGIALLEPKALTWFTPDGARVGRVTTADPLRRAFRTPQGLVVETRQHRAVIDGAPAWWEA